MTFLSRSIYPNVSAATDVFAVTFPYIQQAYVKVRLLEDDYTDLPEPLDLGVDYEFTSEGEITLSIAHAEGLTVDIRRETPKELPALSSPTSLTAAALNARYTILLHCVQEAQDSFDTLLSTSELERVLRAIASLGQSVVIWETATAYTVGQLVVDGDTCYLVAVSHTSGVLATDVDAERLVRVFGRERFQAAGTGAVSRVMEDKLREVAVSLEDYGAIEGDDANATAALHAAIAALGPNGGYVDIPPGDFRLNAEIAQHNVTLRGRGGRGQYDLAVLRPFDITKPTLTFGDDETEFHCCGIENLHVSGSDGSEDGKTKWANNAPQALLLKGGTIGFEMRRSTLYNGRQSLGIVPSATASVTGLRTPGSLIRNEVSDNALARGIFSTRVGVGDDAGYNTDNRIEVKLNCNGSATGAEFDGTDAVIAAEVGGYWDVKPGKGVLLKGGSSMYCYGLDLDPGASDAVVIETDQTGSKDVARYVTGILRTGGQRMKWGDASTTPIPAYNELFSYKALMSNPVVVDKIAFTNSGDPSGEVAVIEMAGESGPLRMTGQEWHVSNTTDSVSATTGAITTAGGIAAEKSISAGDALQFFSSIYRQGVKVLGARAAAPPADATDLATAITLVNALKGIIQSHGLSE